MTPEERNLTPEALAMLQASDEERIEYCKLDHIIAYDAAQEVVAFVDGVARSKALHRSRYRYVASPSNNGKSMICTQLEARYPAEFDQSTRTIRLTVIVVEFPGEGDLKSFYCRVLDKLGVKYRASASEVALGDQMFRMLRTVGCKVLVIDEINNMLASQRNEFNLQRLRNVLRDLGAHLKISVVALGLSSAHGVLCVDTQLANRFEPHQLPLWYDEPRTHKFLRSYERTLPLREASQLGRGRLATRIAGMSEHLLGEMVSIVKLAAVKAIELKVEKIDDQVLDALNWVKPSQRRDYFSPTRKLS